MPLIEWNDRLSVNVEEIDNQHRQIVKFINDLDAAMKQGKGGDALSDIVEGLKNYAVSHFATEEQYFEQFAYPRTFAHRQEHAIFTSKVAAFKKNLENGDRLMSIEVLIFMSKWLVNHITGSDKDYSKLFNDKGLV